MKSIAIIIFLFPLGIYAQQDSTATLLLGKVGMERLRILENITVRLSDTDVKSAAVYSQEALHLAKKLNDAVAIEKLEGQLGQIMRLQSALDSSKIYYVEAIAMAKLNSAPEREAQYLNGMSVLYRQQGELQQGIAVALQALKAASTVKADKQVGDAYHNIAFIFNTLNNYDSALLYFRKSLAIRKVIGDSSAIAGSYNGFGLVFMGMERYDTARKWYIKAASLITEKKHPRQLAMVYNNIGVTYENQGQYDECRVYYLKSLALKEKTNDRRGMAATQNNLGDSYRESGDPDKAIYHARIGERLSIETKSLEYLITSHEILAYAYELKKDYRRALKEHQTFKDLQDSLYNENKTRQINELMNKNAMERKQAENNVLKASATLNEYSIARQKTVIITAVITLIVVSALLIFVYRIYRTSKKIAAELAVQKGEAESANINLNAVLEDNNHMMSIMVHDLRSPMNRVLGLADLIEKDGPLNDYQETYLKMIAQAAAQGRRVVDDLLTISKKEALTIEKISVESFLNDFLIQYHGAATEKGIVLKLETDGMNIEMETDKEAFRRILENLISNAIKFSPQGRTVTVKTAEESQSIAVYISDEGPGFSEDDKKQMYRKFTRLSAKPTGGEGSTGLGLAIVKQLIDQLQGKIFLDSVVGQGSVFKVTFPSVRNHA